MGTGKASILYFLKKEVKAVLEGRILLLQLANCPNTTQKMKFFVLDFFSKCDKLTFIEKILNRKSHFLYSESFRETVRVNKISTSSN